MILHTPYTISRQRYLKTKKMRNYRVTITTDRYPTEYNVQGSGWHIAATRAIKLWRGKFPSSQCNQMSLLVVKGAKINEVAKE